MDDIKIYRSLYTYHTSKNSVEFDVHWYHTTLIHYVIRAVDESVLVTLINSGTT